MSELLGALVQGALPAAIATLVLVAFARAVGLVDDGSDARERKLQGRAVPLVGGFGIAIGLAVLCVTGDDRVAPRPVLAALAAALALGAADDLAPRGLPVVAKLAGQIVVAGLCAACSSSAGEPAALLFAMALLSMNAFNTVDNADGVATTLGALGVGFLAPSLAAPMLGFLPFNLWVRRKSPGGSSTPLAYLGDGGSHLLGVIVALVSPAWPVLALPLADLARLSVVRVRRGSRPWIGDRRHLAHRLQARGLGPTAVVVVLLLVAAPSVVAPHTLPGVAWALPLGIAATLVLYAAAVRWTPDVP